jgi:uncharacterized protein YceK
MKKIICLTVAAAMLLSGCASVETTRAFHGLKVDQSPMVEHINGTIWGIYLLPTIPLIIPYEEGPIDVDTCVNMVTRKAQQLGYTRVCDLQSHCTSWWIIPSFVLWYKEVQVSGNAVK